MPKSLLLSLALLLASTGSARAEALPPQVDLRGDFQQLGLTCKSQGSRGTCSLFAVTAVANFEMARQAPDQAERFSEEYLVWAADKATGKFGDQAMFYEATAGLEQLGICRDEEFAYQRRGERQAPADDLVEQAARYAHRWRVHWIKRWDARNGLASEQWDALRHALAAGHPVACGLRWVRHNDPDIREVPPADEVFDGHSITFVGYQDDPEWPGGGWLWVRNSRGSRWGEEGYGRMSYAYAQTYANDALWLEVLPEGGQQPVATWEAEELAVQTDKCEASPQRMNRYGSRMWSGRKQLACQAQQGGCATLTFEVPAAGTYRVALVATAAPDYGRIALALDGEPQEGEHDLYAGRVCPAGRLELPSQELAAGRHELKVMAVDKSPHSRGYSFGIDRLEILPAMSE